MTRALILGIGGQDGAYLARLLVARGFEVSGTVREGGSLQRLAELQTLDAVTLLAAGMIEALAVAHALPDQVYDLRGPAPWQAADSELVAAQTRAVLAAVDGSATRLLVAGAGPDAVFDSDFRAGKDAVSQLVADARAAGSYAVTAHLSEHESRLSGPSTAARLIAAVQAVARGTAATIDLAHPGRAHDWGWAPEYVDALRLMLEPAQPADQAIATGTAMTERAFARHACEWFGVDPELCGPGYAEAPTGAPRADALGWRAFTYGRDLVRTLCEGAS